LLLPPFSPNHPADPTILSNMQASL
jgi:hypothetical protein